MRNIWVLVALTMLVGCGGSDGKDGREGVPGPTGAAGPPGANGQDGEDGAPGADGADGSNGMDGIDGMDGAPGADGGAILQGSGAPAAALGADGDIYIDTVSRDVYQKSDGVWTVVTNLSGGPPGPKGDQGDPGADGADGASVLTGSGAPTAGLGNVGDVYIDSTTGNLYTKAAGGWTLSGSLKGPAGEDGADGEDGVDVKDTVGGVRWFAFALNAAFADTPGLIDSQTHTEASSAAQFTFTGANQHGRLGFFTTGSFVGGGVDLTPYDFLDINAAVTGGAVSSVRLYLTNGPNVGCQWITTAAAGPSYSFDLKDFDVLDPSRCYNNSLDLPDFTLESVTNVEIGIVSNDDNTRTLTVTSIGLSTN
jgi:hypothetical protein